MTDKDDADASPEEESRPSASDPIDPASQPEPRISWMGDYELDDVDVKELLREALKPPDSARVDVTKGVQQRIRERTRGRYFRDGWSVSSAPKATFLVTSLLMLVLVILVMILLSPTGIEILGQ